MSAVMEEKTFRGLREVAVLVFFASALFFLIALLTFSNEDPGFTHARTIRHLGNACGLFGAWLADFTLNFFGLCAYLFPAIIFWQGYCFHKDDGKHQEKLWLALPCLGFIAALVSISALLELYKPRMGIELPRNTGGILGEEISNIALISLGNSGATLFLVVLLIAGITLITNISWMGLIDNIGKHTMFCFRQLFHRNNPQQKHVVDQHSSSDIEVSKPKKTAKKLLSSKPLFEKAVSNVTEQFDKTSTIKKASVKRHKSNGNVLPVLDLLDNREIHVVGYSQNDLEAMSRMVETILADFNVIVQVVAFHPGPVITRFELQPAAGVKVSRIVTLSKDLARALSVTSVRIVEIIPGKTVVGLEIPNREREMVTLRELLVSNNFTKAKSLLTLAMGKDIAGTPMVADLGKMPHVLVAGTTGSGKSVAINTMILSLLYKATPEQVRLIMIDPKMLELSVYEGIPHLLTPVVTDMKEASNALRWAVGEMERRYKLMSKMGVRNLAGFNQLISEAKERGEVVLDPLYQAIDPDAEAPALEPLYSVVIIIDELADMMMLVGKKVEELIARLAQKARAAGIHLVLATQRPSVDVLTGLIKANVPTRISFQVSSRIDSRTILDQGGAETLLGNGDMLFLPSGTSIPVRAHGAFVADQEVHRVVEFLKQTAPPNYLEEITRGDFADNDGFGGGSDYSSSSSENASLYDQAVQFVTESRKASISSVQRRFKIGYNRAANLIEEMEKAGIVSTAEANGTRVVLAPPPIKD